MDMHSRYLKVLRYLKARTKREKSQILELRKKRLRQPTEWDASKVGYIEEMVVHCGASTSEYINTLNTTEISSGWWEAIMGRNIASGR